MNAINQIGMVASIVSAICTLIKFVGGKDGN